MKIESCIPIPKMNATGYKDTALLMKVGDSVLFHKAYQASYLQQILKKLKYNSTTRTISKGQHRVWRIK